MREILFRGKQAVSGEWVYGSLITETNPFDKDMVMTHIYDDSCNEILVIPETVGQYTGLKDKNGKKIFEGDILHVVHGENSSRISPVYFGEYIDGNCIFDDYRCIGFYVKTPNECDNIGFLLDDEFEFEFEVIGNIFDNPELLKGDKT